MNKLKKLLRKLDSSERDRIEKVIALIVRSQLAGLDIKSLQGQKNTFRVRVGDLRIIFSKFDGKNIIVDVVRRNEKTYRDL